jgi:hypothetical protein
MTATRFHFVPYRGGAPAMQDLVAGQIDMMIDTPTNSHRAVTMSLNSRWRLAPLGMCAPAPFAHGQQMNIGSSFPSYLKRLNAPLRDKVTSSAQSLVPLCAHRRLRTAQESYSP